VVLEPGCRFGISLYPIRRPLLMRVMCDGSQRQLRSGPLGVRLHSDRLVREGSASASQSICGGFSSRLACFAEQPRHSLQITR
jgi:hypothetical protein